MPVVRRRTCKTIREVGRDSAEIWSPFDGALLQSAPRVDDELTKTVACLASDLTFECRRPLFESFPRMQIERLHARGCRT